jgi:general secretion pathway protein E
MAKIKECSLDNILQLLVDQKIVDREKASMVSSLVAANDRNALHPLESIASRQWLHWSQPDQMLTLDFLTEWLANQSGVARYYFDPLKMDVALCTSIMSYAYASRFGIIAVKVTTSDVVIAVSDPFDTEWLNELSRIVPQPISLVLGNPKESLLT